MLGCWELHSLVLAYGSAPFYPLHATQPSPQEVSCPQLPQLSPRDIGDEWTWLFPAPPQALAMVEACGTMWNHENIGKTSHRNQSSWGVGGDAQAWLSPTSFCNQVVEQWRARKHSLVKAGKLWWCRGPSTNSSGAKDSQSWWQRQGKPLWLAGTMWETPGLWAAQWRSVVGLLC